MKIIGHVTIAGQRRRPVELNDRQEVKTFLESHLFDDELVLTDVNDRLVFRAVDGVDLYSSLEELRIDLPALYRKLRSATIETSGDSSFKREPWEDHYDSIGLSPDEIAMRQRSKRLAKTARTVADIVELLAGTYFDARFETEDRTRSWGYFDPDDFSVIEQLADHNEGARIHLSPDARVRHSGSGEDIHSFVLLDPP